MNEAPHDHEDKETQHPQHGYEVHITVDGEPYEAQQQEMSPNEIIREFGHKDPTINYLVQIHGHEKISYEGKGSTEISLRNGMRFQIISTGPTTVSEIV